jgi:hypothetical protein
VRAATSGEHPHGSITIRRTSDEPYAASFEVTELKSVAKETRDLDAAYIQGDCDIAPAFLKYARPLVGSLPSAGRLSDFPIR